MLTFNVAIEKIDRSIEHVKVSRIYRFKFAKSCRLFDKLIESRISFFSPLVTTIYFFAGSDDERWNTWVRQQLIIKHSRFLAQMATNDFSISPKGK